MQLQNYSIMVKTHQKAGVKVLCLPCHAEPHGLFFAERGKAGSVNVKKDAFV